MIATSIAAGLAGLGYLLVSAICAGESRLVRIAYAVPAGFGLYALMSLLGFMLQMPPAVPLAGCALVAGFVLCLAIRANPTSTRSNSLSPIRILGEAALVALACFGVMQVSALTLQPVLSFDSFKQSAVAFSFYNPIAYPSTIEQLASWSFFLISLHSLAGAFDGEGFINGLHSLIFLATLALLIVTMRMIALLSKPGQAWLLWGVVLLWCTTYFNVFHAVYIHNGMLAAMYALAVAGIALRVFRDRAGSGWSALLFLCATSLCLVRTEAALYAFVLLALAGLLFDAPGRYARLAITGTALVTIAWFLFLLGGIGLGSDILTPARIIALLGAMAGLLVLGALTPAIRYVLTAYRTACIAFAALPVLITLLFIVHPASTTANVYAIVTNLTLPFWAVTGVCIIAFYLFALQSSLVALGRGDLGRMEQTVLFLTLSTTGMIILILVFGTIRIPYRLGWGDSANRLMVMVVPLALTAAFAAAVCLSSPSRPTAAGLRLPVSVQTGLLAGIAILLFPYLAYALYPSKNVAWRAEVDAEGDYYPNYEVALALDSPCYRDRHYAAATKPGERVVTVRLNRNAPLERVILCFYERQHFEDFTIELSEDGNSWISLFDTSSASPDAALLDGDRWSLPINRPEAFGHLRLTYRRSEGQNRFLLRGLKVLSK